MGNFTMVCMSIFSFDSLDYRGRGVAYMSRSVTFGSLGQGVTVYHSNGVGSGH